ncbi:hypothetical protein As57867_006197, partial [Aphanomyces stellatus]
MSMTTSNDNQTKVILEAIKAGDVARVRDLVGLPGVDVNARGSISIVSNDEDAAEVTPLMAAAALGQVEIVDFLLADPRIQVNYALPVLYVDMQNGLTTNY